MKSPERCQGTGAGRVLGGVGVKDRDVQGSRLRGGVSDPYLHNVI
jgi:hypothetical protein